MILKPGEVLIESGNVSITNFEMEAADRKSQLRQILRWTRDRLIQVEKEQGLRWWQQLVNLATGRE